ncbi:MAG: hypothetical protein ACOX8R_09020 [Bacillota bacterium]|jgi:hypothetical protein
MAGASRRFCEKRGGFSGTAGIIALKNIPKEEKFSSKHHFFTLISGIFLSFFCQNFTHHSSFFFVLPYAGIMSEMT